MNAKPVEILLVDDSDDDILLTKSVLEDSKIHLQLSVVKDGVEALLYLRALDKYASRKLPDLILLDLNMPKKDGREVLAEIKMDEDLKHIPVIILTTSKADEDIISSYKHHAASYVTKPMDYGELSKIVRAIEDFWLTVVKLPTKD